MFDLQNFRIKLYNVNIKHYRDLWNVKINQKHSKNKQYSRNVR